VASFSIGGLLASITMILTGGLRRPERSTLLHTAMWFALLLVFGHMPTLGGALATLFLAGFVQNVAMISMAALEGRGSLAGRFDVFPCRGLVRLWRGHEHDRGNDDLRFHGYARK